jgi:hypothetical protein
MYFEHNHDAIALEVESRLYLSSHDPLPNPYDLPFPERVCSLTHRPILLR